MSGGVNFAPSSTAREVVSVVLPPSLNPTATGRLECRPVIRFPEQLRLHPALDEIGWTGDIDEFNDASLLQSAPEPILITTNGTILAGLGTWRSAVFDGTREINCIEYPLGEDQSLLFIITLHQARRRWNDFVRIRLALTQEINLQHGALDNMRAGGKNKGSANLPEAERIDVRQEIAKLAGTGTGNVSKVKAILRSAHPNIIAASQNGLLSIHRAWLWSTLPKSQQKLEFARHEEERTKRKILHEFLPKPAKVSLDPAEVIESLQRLEALQPGSIDIRTSRRLRTTVILGQDFSELPDAQKELDWHA
jgi:hypothetical protein